jgi:hypothetical protein
VGRLPLEGSDGAARCPIACLPKEIEKALDKLGKDGDKVRGTIERRTSPIT